MRYLHFRNARGDLQEGHDCSSRGFCAFFAFETPIFRHFEHKIGVFVLFLPSRPPFSGISSTKLGFLCFFGLRNPRFRAFRAQNRGFCALLAFGTPIFGTFEHKIAIFVLGEVSSGGVPGSCCSGCATRVVLHRECCSCPGCAARVVARSICLLQ